jgi:hypothetical protein
MAETKAASTNQASYELDPLYQEVMQRLAIGDQAGASASLHQLIERFPGEPALQDLLVRTQLRATVATSQPPPIVHSAPAPMLRSLVLILLAITIGLAGITGFFFAYERFVIDPRNAAAAAAKIADQRARAMALVTARSWPDARKAQEELLTAVPDNPEIEATATAVNVIADKGEALQGKYEDARAAEDAGDIQTALDLYRQIEAEDLGYGDVAARIHALEEEQALEELWQQSESLIQAGDLAGAIPVLTEIRSRDAEFRKDQVAEQLSRVYAQMARDLIRQADGSVDTLNQAVDYCYKALAEKPVQPDLLNECNLASDFAKGAKAFANQDWVGAVAAWQEVYATQPDYQDGRLKAKLNQAYPQAASQLIDGANGNVAQLTQAIGYLDQALALQPGNQELIDERGLAVDFVAGAADFDQNKWNLAIAQWSAIYAVQPGYQNGVLEDRLREACANVPEADRTGCPP